MVPRTRPSPSLAGAVRYPLPAPLRAARARPAGGDGRRIARPPLASRARTALLTRAPLPPGAPMRDLKNFEIQRQPDDQTCGPTCLHAVYRYFGDELELDRLISEIPMLEQGGGTLEVMLGVH